VALAAQTKRAKVSSLSFMGNTVIILLKSLFLHFSGTGEKCHQWGFSN